MLRPSHGCATIPPGAAGWWGALSGWRCHPSYGDSSEELVDLEPSQPRDPMAVLCPGLPAPSWSGIQEEPGSKALPRSGWEPWVPPQQLSSAAWGEEEAGGGQGRVLGEQRQHAGVVGLHSRLESPSGMGSLGRRESPGHGWSCCRGHKEAWRGCGHPVCCPGTPQLSPHLLLPPQMVPGSRPRAASCAPPPASTAGCRRARGSPRGE